MIQLSRDWRNPEDLALEIVERKGLGHPDTLADALADAVSRKYSLYCLDQFGAIPHHNVDKLYIGAGLFTRRYGFSEMVNPVRVQINGRMSDTMNGQDIPLVEIQTTAVANYLRHTLPHLDIKRELIVDCNSTTYSKVPHWFQPRDVKDLPEHDCEPTANDTSVVVAHWPPTITERCAYELERSLWTNDAEGNLAPMYNHIGQDVKVMVYRAGNDIDITMCIPVISTMVVSKSEFDEVLRDIELTLSIQAKAIVEGTQYRTTVKVNPDGSGRYRAYLLAIGSCIDCGEEGVVGRGNNNQGVISVFREHSVEAPSGKNPVYHTGRVLGALVAILSRRIHQELGSACTIIAMTKNKHPLLPPTVLNIKTEHQLSQQDVDRVANEVLLNHDYVSVVLDPASVRR